MDKVIALYCRLSPRPDGSYEGVDLQEQWGREDAARTWPGVPIEVFSDKGISAANGDHRPQYERLREWISGGRVAQLWTVEQTRLERREVGWFELAAELDAAGITELHTRRDGLVRVRDEVASIKAVLAASEVRKLKQRTLDRLEANARAGQPPGSKPFGYVHAVVDGLKTYVVDEEQAAAIRQAAEQVLSGWSLANVAAELGKRGVRSVRGKQIVATTIKQFLRSPTIAGFRVHHGEILGPGNWPPILDEATWREVVAILDQPRKVHRKGGGTYPVPGRRGPAGRRYLLTGGLIVCGECEAPLIGAVKTLRDGRKVPYYSCHPVKQGKGCVAIPLDPTEQHVLDVLWAELDKPAFLDALGVDDSAGRREDLGRRLQRLDGKRRTLASRWAADDLTDAEWEQARHGLAESEQALRRELSEVPPPNVRVDIAGARSAWPAMTLDEQREFLRLLVDRVTVRRGIRGRPQPPAERVAVEWRKR